MSFFNQRCFLNMQTLVEIGPSNASQGQHRRKDATEQNEKSDTRKDSNPGPRLSSVLPLRSVGRSNFDKGLHILTTTLIQKRHIIIRTAILYNEINSGQIMKKTLSNNMSRKVHMNGRQRSEFKI